jgi:pimeloyl-ACP methyl ester carboxylesterase
VHAVPQASTLSSSVIAPAASGERDNLYLLHGIYGRGRNWAVIARRLAAERGDWQSVLLDLRGHGASPPFAPPHTVSETAKDVARLSASLELPLHAVLGHSFGGKVALALAATDPPGLRHVWLVDSTPAPKVPDGSAWRMLQVARDTPGPFPSRQAARTAIERAGFEPPVAAWMVSNLVRRGGVYHWRLDFDLLEMLLHDFFRQDYWHVIEEPPSGVHIHIVKATGSSILTNDAVARIEEAQRRHGRVHLHHVDGGHWVHTDNPDAVTALLVAELPRRG